MYRTRAYRRHQAWRSKQRTRRKLIAWDWGAYKNGTWTIDQPYLGPIYRAQLESGEESEAACIGRNDSVHCRPCSNPWCCGNSRRFNGERTVQERRAFQKDWEPEDELVGDKQPRSRKKRSKVAIKARKQRRAAKWERYRRQWKELVDSVRK